MITISKENISSILLMEAYSELYNAKEKISLFENKYNLNFENFNRKIKSEQENFQSYDDYIEWKAYIKILNETEQKINDLKNGNFTVA
ncbi:hypothetical protein ES705_31445 [subsurface metagenome]